VPVADSAPILQNFTNEAAPMLRSIPPLTATSYWCETRPWVADQTAARPDAHAASVVKFGPWKLNRFATRPAVTLASSPGIVSSVISNRLARNPLRVSARISRRTSSGSASNAGEF
jgi:hypothetical protein